jgi:hypothetical protein
LFSANLGFQFANGAGSPVGSNLKTITASELGVDIVVHGVHDGTFLRFYFNGVEIGSPVSITGYTAFASDMRVGRYPDDASPLPSTNFISFGVAGGHYVPSAAEVAANAQAILATGRMQAIPGKTDHLYDCTADVLASGQEAVPATVLDRVGTDHLTRIGPDYAIGAVRGLRLLSNGPYPTNGLLTVPGGGIAGATSALTVSMLCSLLSPIVAAGGLEMIASKYVDAGSGWDFRRTGTAGTLGNLVVAFGTPGGGNPSPPVYAVQAQDVGTLIHLAFTYNGSSQSFYVNGTLIGSTAIGGTYANPATPMLIGARGDAGFGNQNTTLFVAIGGGAYVATQAELAAQATASIAAGQLVAIPGKTDQRRYNYAQDALEQNTPLPVFCVDRMGNADPLVRLGSGLTLAQRVERVWSYETSPILYGHAPVVDADHYATAAPPSFLLNAAGMFWLAMLVNVTSQAVANRARVFASTYNPSGALLQTGVTNTTMSFLATDAGGVNRTSPSIVIGTADVGKLQLVVGVHDGTNVRIYWKRAQQGSGTACSGFLPSANPLYVGRDPRLTFAADGMAIYGIAGGAGVPSLAEIQALHDACMATEDLVAIPGKTSMLCSYTRAARANGGVLPAQIPDLVGGNHLVRAGSPALATSYARAWGW